LLAARQPQTPAVERILQSCVLASVVKERPQAGEPPTDRRRRQLSRRHVFHVALQARRRDVLGFGLRPLLEIGEVEAIGA
jgi:hypothetical protein